MFYLNNFIRQNYDTFLQFAEVWYWNLYWEVKNDTCLRVTFSRCSAIHCPDWLHATSQPMERLTQCWQAGGERQDSCVGFHQFKKTDKVRKSLLEYCQGDWFFLKAARCCRCSLVHSAGLDVLSEKTKAISCSLACSLASHLVRNRCSMLNQCWVSQDLFAAAVIFSWVLSLGISH